MNDRSIMVREFAAELLSDSLRSKRSALRSGIPSVFKKQRVNPLPPLIPQMLMSAKKNQDRAALELLMELKRQESGYVCLDYLC